MNFLGWNRRNKKVDSHNVFCLLFLAFVILFLLSSCGNLQELIGLKEEEESIPQDVRDSAKGLLELIGNVCGQDHPTDASTNGMVVSWEQQNVKLKIVFTNYAPDQTQPNMTISGTFILTMVNQNPFTMSISGSITIANYTIKTIEMEGTAVFPGDSPKERPKSLTGTYKVDGTSYDLAKIYASIDWDEGDEGDEGEDETSPPYPPTEGYPPEYAAPSELWNKTFFLIGSRLIHSANYDTESHRGDRITFNSNGQECTFNLESYPNITAYIGVEDYNTGTMTVKWWWINKKDSPTEHLIEPPILFTYGSDYLYVEARLYGESDVMYYYFHTNPNYTGPLPIDEFF